MADRALAACRDEHSECDESGMSSLGLSTVRVIIISTSALNSSHLDSQTAEAILRVSTELSVTAPIVRELKQQQLCAQTPGRVLPQCVCCALLKQFQSTAQPHRADLCASDPLGELGRKLDQIYLLSTL